ncbi:hypothetical protein [Amorphus coralli]|uniref:hypothetical protein n=1 Tax=Amorphus coralli TaxID=340680 RepID=UPI0003764A13|nr:hypothetical protein [Amorphus coralli]
MLSDELQIFRELWESARQGEIEILPPGAAQMSRFLERAVREARKLETEAVPFQDVDPATLAAETDETPAVDPALEQAGKVVRLVPRGQRSTRRPTEPGGAA